MPAVQPGLLERPTGAFQHPYSWASLGVEVRGRSHVLKVCYRTSQQIRSAADRLLPAVLHDTDGSEDERRGIISVFEGPLPEVRRLALMGAVTISLALANSSTAVRALGTSCAVRTNTPISCGASPASNHAETISRTHLISSSGDCFMWRAPGRGSICC